MLWRENYRSVNYRYGERLRVPEYHYAPPRALYLKSDVSGYVPLPGVLAKQISCYDYQTCEHPTYYTSRARSAMLSLSESLLRCVPGYDYAGWGV